MSWHRPVRYLLAHDKPYTACRTPLDASGGGRRHQRNADGGGGGEGKQGGGPPRPAGAGQLELLGGVFDGLGGDPGGGLVAVAGQITQQRVEAEPARRLPTV